MDYKHIPTSYFDKNGKEICEGHMIKCHIECWVDVEEDWRQFDLVLTCCHVDSIESWVFRCDKPFMAAYIWEEIKDGNPKIVGKDGLIFCPFCESEVKIVSEHVEYNDLYAVMCPNCSASIGLSVGPDKTTPDFFKEETVIAAWNKRIAQDDEKSIITH